LTEWTNFIYDLRFWIYDFGFTILDIKKSRPI
jgi:hypothetical protein